MVYITADPAHSPPHGKQLWRCCHRVEHRLNILEYFQTPVVGNVASDWDTEVQYPQYRLFPELCVVCTTCHWYTYRACPLCFSLSRQFCLLGREWSPRLPPKNWVHLVVSVKSIMQDSRYSKQAFDSSRSSSILFLSDLVLPRIINGSGGLLPLRLHRCRTPPLRPLFLTFHSQHDGRDLLRQVFNLRQSLRHYTGVCVAAEQRHLSCWAALVCFFVFTPVY